MDQHNKKQATGVWNKYIVLLFAAAIVVTVISTAYYLKANKPNIQDQAALQQKNTGTQPLP